MMNFAAVDVLEAMSMSSPRKSRKAIQGAMDVAEALAETVKDEAWCDRLAANGPDALEVLRRLVSSVNSLSAESSVAEALATTSQLAQSLRRCGSPVVQSLAVLHRSGSAGSGGVLDALEVLRGLSGDRQECSPAEESAAFEAVKDRLAAADGHGRVGGEVVSACTCSGSH